LRSAELPCARRVLRTASGAPTALPNPQSGFRNRQSKIANRRFPRGAVLLEVVLALALFVSGALVVLAGLNSALRTARRVQFEARAADLAVTLLSEIQIGVATLENAGPTAYEEPELAGWSWQVATADEEQLTDGPPFKRVQVVIRSPDGFSCRLAQTVEYDQATGQVAGLVPAAEAAP